MITLRVYVGIILMRDREVFLVKRGGHAKWAAGQWNFPGGGVEAGESFAEAAAREAYEEMGVVISGDAIEMVHVLRVRGDGAEDVAGFYFLARTWSGDPVNKEPDRHSDAQWFSLDNLPEVTTSHALQAIRNLTQRIGYSEISD